MWPSGVNLHMVRFTVEKVKSGQVIATAVSPITDATTAPAKKRPYVHRERPRRRRSTSLRGHPAGA